MSILKFSPLRPFLVFASIALAPWTFVFPVHAATHGHYGHHRKATGNQPFSGAKPVVLAAHPGTAQDADARLLNKADLEDAAKHHDKPVVLLGSAPLSTGKDDEALFVQLQSARLCGSAGCTTSVYLRHNNNWTTVLDSVNGDIAVLPTRHRGMSDLLINKNDRWIWDGSQYQDTMSAPPVPELGSTR